MGCMGNRTFGRTVLTACVLGLALVAASGSTGRAARQGGVAQGEMAAVDRARAAGLAGSYKTWSAAEIDYDRDGRRDVWISKHAWAKSRLWRNTGGRYVAVRTVAWPHRNPRGKVIDRHDCDWADVDRNGRPDAYCTTGRFTANRVKLEGELAQFLDRPRGTEDRPQRSRAH